MIGNLYLNPYKSRFCYRENEVVLSNARVFSIGLFFEIHQQRRNFLEEVNEKEKADFQGHSDVIYSYTDRLYHL
jgi:hypothetical protein